MNSKKESDHQKLTASLHLESSVFLNVQLHLFKIVSNFYLFSWIGILFVARYKPRQINSSFVTYWCLITGIQNVMWVWEVSTLQVNLLCLWSQWFLCSLSTLTVHCWIKILKKAENCDCVCWEGIGKSYKDKWGDRNKGREILQGENKRKKVLKNKKPIFSMARNVTVECHRISADTRVGKCIYSLSGEVAEKSRWQKLWMTSYYLSWSRSRKSVWSISEGFHVEGCLFLVKVKYVVEIGDCQE